MKDNDYLFISAMLRAREAKMLDRERIERMLSAQSFTEAAGLLTDIGYEDLSDQDANGIDEALAQHRRLVFDDIGRLLPEPGPIEAFRLKYDYHNAKVIIKAEGAGVLGEHLFADSGRVEADSLKQAYEEDHFAALPLELAKAMQLSKATLARSGNPQLADFELDRAYFAEMSSLAEKIQSGFFSDYVRILIDSTNLRTAVRIVRMGRGHDFLLSALISGGGADPGRIAQSVMSGGDGLAAAFTDSYLHEAVFLASEAMKGGSVTAFELACDNALASYLESARMVPFGREVVIEYIALVESEIKAIRMILTERLAGIDPDVTRERLRDINA